MAITSIQHLSGGLVIEIKVQGAYTRFRFFRNYLGYVRVFELICSELLEFCLEVVGHGTSFFSLCKLMMLCWHCWIRLLA